MKVKLSGRTVAVTGARMAEEFGNIVRKMGGSPLVFPAQGIVKADDEAVAERLKELFAAPVDWIVLTTGFGTESLLEKAEAAGCRERLLELLRSTPIAARGYKTANALRKLGIAPQVRDDDGTTDGLFRALTARVPLAGKRIAVQLYGDPAAPLLRKLREAGAVCLELLPYLYVEPEPGPVDELLSLLAQGKPDAVVFTSAVQVRNLQARAAATGRREALRAFDGPTVAAAVGKVTEEALRDAGVRRVVVPEEERLGTTLVELGRFFEAAGQPAG